MLEVEVLFNFFRSVCLLIFFVSFVFFCFMMKLLNWWLCVGEFGFVCLVISVSWERGEGLVVECLGRWIVVLIEVIKSRINYGCGVYDFVFIWIIFGLNVWGRMRIYWFGVEVFFNLFRCLWSWCFVSVVDFLWCFWKLDVYFLVDVWCFLWI